MCRGCNVREHLDKFEDIIDKFNNFLSIIMLYSLPANFQNFRVAIESRDKLPKPEELKIKILE